MINFPSKEQYDADDLRQIVEILRGENGCPWDRVQTHQTLRRNLLEESAELCEAIDRADPAMMREELGDVWLQVIFHASLEEQAGRFTLDDVADAECRKLISRHAHVFGNAKAADAAQALQVWEEQKRSEKHQKTPGEAMDAVCRTLPALWRAEKVQKKAALGGTDRTDPRDVMSAIRGCAEELDTAIGSGDSAAIRSSLGELLFQTVYAARLTATDPEEALHGACEDYIRRYRENEQQNG